MSIKVLTINVIGIPDSREGNLVEADVFQDYDAVVIDPENLFDLYGSRYYQNVRNSPGKLDPDFGKLCVEVNRRRRSEVNTLLNHSGILICLLRPIITNSFYVRDQRWSYVSNYNWLFTDAELDRELGEIVFSKGKTVDFVDPAHAFFEYLNTKPSWSAYIDVNTCKSWKTLASAFDTHVLSLSKRVGSGHMVFLPSYYDHNNGELLKQSISKLLKGKEVIAQPNWAVPILIPGQKEFRTKIEENNSEISSLENERENLIKKDNELERWKWLLYAKGKHELEPIVLDAFRLIGFDVKLQPDKDSDGLIVSQFGSALLEVVGSSGSIRLEKFGELLKNVGNFITQTSQQVKGILVGNPFCEEPIDNRPPKDSQKQLFAKEIIDSAINQNVTVLQSGDLFEVVSGILKGEISEDQKANIKRKILEGKGYLKLP